MEDMRRAAQRQMEEDPDIDGCFAYFRRKESVVDVQWVKEQIYRTSCVPERCPATRSLVEIFLRLGLGAGGQDGEAVVKNDVGFRFN
ncbi:EsV-1-131 [Ectocarpus siliculosus virus 1]|uniref:EsV-1-131 n=1 Tax=Ectocarpus siliculosus virus 1 (isolate New Zealand/Kaikoura/1988) TaxID=654926 RepID=Q8QNE8_ESV1K|nr:EsV-1-131 [Ectocarpus siliculosus virus 1]AAK14549.1 EsV-1-131 [Ectocarpus siliculosus virus 1]